MKENMKKLSLLLFLVPSVIHSTFLIDFSGPVGLGGDLIETETAIVIAVSNVTLDLGGYNVSTSDFDGIVINPGLQNIKIVNGTIRDLQGTGIIVGEGCTNIYIDNIIFLNCVQGALDFQGSLGNEINRTYIADLDISETSTALDGGEVIHLNYVNDFELYNVNIIEVGNVVAPLSVVKIENSNRCELGGIQIRRSIASSFTGFECIASQNCRFRGCSIIDNSADTDFIGFSFDGSAATQNRCNNCDVSGNSITNSSAGPMYGYKLTESSLVTVKRCTFADNTNLGASATSHVFGYYLDQAQQCSIVSNGAYYNSAPNAGGHMVAGFFMGTTGGAGTGVKLCGIVHNSAVGNASDLDASSFGFLASSGVDGNELNVYVNNIAYLNGLTAPIIEAQIVSDQGIGSNPGGIPFNSVKSQTIDKLNGISDRVSNLRIGG
jgi:hypothetical protein